jgi:Tol biopolymer transport system component
VEVTAQRSPPWGIIAIVAVVVVAVVGIGATFGLGIIGGDAATPTPTATAPPTEPPPTATPRPTATPIPTPDLGGDIVFSTDPTEEVIDDIYITPAGTFDPRPLVVQPGHDRMPAWSPDGSTVAWIAPTGLHVIRADGTGMQQLTDDITDRKPTWSPAGDAIVFQRKLEDGEELFRIDLGAATPAQPVRITDQPGPDYDASWSPDGSKIAFISSRGGNGDIWVMNADGTRPVRITVTDENEDGPTWSPDGSLIAFTRDVEGTHHLFVMAADGSDVRRIGEEELPQGDPVFSPDGQLIAYQRGGPAVFEIAIVDLEGNDVAVIGPPEGGTRSLWPSWRAETGR